MARDGRGTPGRIILKNQPRLKLSDVLRRRRTTLKALLDEMGISTYSGVENWCDRMGILPPSREEYEVAVPPAIHVNDPQEGVIVLEPLPTIKENTGLPFDPTLEGDAVSEASEPSQKRKKTKKDETPSDG